MPIRDVYTGFVLVTIELHRRLIECIDQVRDEATSTMYLNLMYPFLCALNRMELLSTVVEPRFGAKLHDLAPADLRAAAKLVLDTVGPPPDVGLQEQEEEEAAVPAGAYT
jgi:hypothetical protein